MKKHLLILSLAAATSMFAACEEQYDTNVLAQQESESLADAYRAPSFAEPDKSTQLNGSPAKNLSEIFNSTGPKIITSMGRSMVITDAQYQEIAEFTSNLVSGKRSQTTKYKTIFEWVVNNIQYNHTTTNYSNDPYEVFKNKIWQRLLTLLLV